VNMRILIIWMNLVDDAPRIRLRSGAPLLILILVFYPLLQSIMLLPSIFAMLFSSSIPPAQLGCADHFLHPTRFSCTQSTSFLNPNISSPKLKLV
jgi:hypothetical protein